MAKTTFSNLLKSCKENIQEYTVYQIGENEVKVKNYLPFLEKLELVDNIVNLSYDESSGIYNTAKVKFFTELNLIFAYTDISFTKAQKENLMKTYDELVESGLMGRIVNMLPNDCGVIVHLVEEQIQAIYKYENSFIGQIKGVTDSFEQTGIDLNNIQNALQNPENLELVKDILTKLG